MTEDTDPDTLCVVSVEDNPGDVRLIEEGIAAVDRDIELVHYRNGERALETFTGTGDDSAVRPDLLFVDMNLPGTSGVEILRRLRQERPDDSLPVVVLSSSENPEDVRRAYAESANAYLTKPTDPDAFIQQVVAAVRFWLTATQSDTQPC